MDIYKKIIAIFSVAIMVVNLFVTSVVADEQIPQIPYAAYSDIELPTTNADGENIIWSSNMPEIIDGTGKVVRPSHEVGTKIVTLTATCGDEEKDFEVLVPHVGTSYNERLFCDFDNSDGLDLSALGKGSISYKNEDGKSYILLENTQSNTSTVSIILDEPVGESGNADIELVINPCATTSVIFYSEEGHQVAKNQMHSSGNFMVAFSNTGTQKNIGNKGTWIKFKYSFSFNHTTPKDSTFSLEADNVVKYPEGTLIYRTGSSAIGTNIKKISISTTKAAADAVPSGTSVDSLKITERIEGDMELAVKNAYDALEIRNADNITGNIDLPKVINGCEVVWASSDKTVIENNGTTYLPQNGEESKYAELTAFIILGNSIMEKKFNITLNPYIDERLTEDADLVDIPLLITGDIVLPEFKNGTRATFISENNELLSSDGKVTRPTEKSVYLPFKIRFENDSDYIEREYKSVIAREIPYLKMNMVYEDFGNITDPSDALFYINSGGETHGEAKIITDEVSGSSVLSSKTIGTSYSPEFRFNSYYDKAVIEFDVRLLTNQANFAYIYGEGICSSMTLKNGTIEVRGSEKSVTFMGNVSPDRWYHFKIVVDMSDFAAGKGDCTTDIYVDGEKLVTALKTRANSTYINRILTAPQDSGGEIRYDNLKVYTDYSENVKKATEDLKLSGIESITSNYTFPVRTEDGINIEFVSEKPHYISDDGKVTRPQKDEDDENVIVYAVLWKDMFTSIKPFEMTVLHLYSDEVSVEKDFSALTLGDLSDVRSNLILPTAGSNGTLITWQSSNEQVITNEGKVTRPSYIKDGRYEEVVLTADISKGNVSAQKEFVVYVAENNFAKKAYVRVSSEDSVNSAVYINDENYDTWWMPAMDEEAVVIADLGNSQIVNRCEVITKGTIGDLTVSYSMDGSKYYDLKITERSNDKVILSFEDKPLRYIKIISRIPAGSGIAEIELYNHISEESLIKKDVEELRKINLSNLTADITLPLTGANGSVITWESSDTSVIGNDGKVNRKNSTVQITLTATLTIGSVSETVDFMASVAGTNSNNNGGGSSGGGSSGGGSSAGASSGGVNKVLPIFNNTTSSVEETKKQAVFEDLEGYDWAKVAIESLYNAGIVNGKDERKFVPGDYITRAEFVKLMCVTLDIPEGDAEFTDVSKADWYAPYVKRAASAGLVVGHEGKFNPNSNITRQDMAVIISRALNLTSDKNLNYSDTSEISDYALHSVAALTEKGIMNGYDGYFAPLRNATRAEAAMVIYSIYNED